jgi:hypothetical protein
MDPSATARTTVSSDFPAMLALGRVGFTITGFLHLMDRMTPTQQGDLQPSARRILREDVFTAER